jgi:hypothetical protein
VVYDVEYGGAMGMSAHVSNAGGIGGIGGKRARES